MNLLEFFNFPKKGLYKSPFRPDKNPSFSVFQYNGEWFWKDHSTGETGTIVHAVMKRFNLSYKEALNIVQKSNPNFGSQSDYKENVTPKPFETYEYELSDVCNYEYFFQFKINAWVLMANNCRCLKRIKMGETWHDVSGYYFDIESLFDDSVGQKFYFPEQKAKIGKKEYKHIHKRRNDHVFGFWSVLYKQTFEHSNYVFMCEGEKDCLVIQSHGFPCFTLGGQTVKTTDLLCKRLKENGINHIYIVFDNDKEEDEQAEKRKQEFEMQGITATIVRVPKIDRIKDVADFVINHDFIELFSCYL